MNNIITTFIILNNIFKAQKIILLQCAGIKEKNIKKEYISKTLWKY